MGRRRGFGQIVQQRSGRYVARYADPDARTKVSTGGKVAPVLHAAPHTFEARIDAEGWLADERRLVASGNWTSPAARAEAARIAEQQRRDATFGVYARAWLAGRHDLRAGTRTSYETAIRKHLLPTFENSPLDEITTATVRAWFASFGNKTPTARAHAYQVLSSIMNQAVDDGLTSRSPCRVKAGGRTKVTREPEVLTLAELLALADAMPERHRALTLLSGLCGLRFGEAVALRRKDVDLNTGVICVRRGATRTKGQKHIGPTKTPASVRDVTAPALVVDALRTYLAGTPITGGRDGLIFVGKNGDALAPTALYGCKPRIEKRGQKRYEKKGYGFYAAREQIGHPALHWHDLRRTAATLGAQTGATVKEIQHRLGHTTPAMALHYQQSTAERDRVIAERLQAQIDEAAR